MMPLMCLSYLAWSSAHLLELSTGLGASAARATGHRERANTAAIISFIGSPISFVATGIGRAIGLLSAIPFGRKARTIEAFHLVVLQECEWLKQGGLDLIVV